MFRSGPCFSSMNKRTTEACGESVLGTQCSCQYRLVQKIDPRAEEMAQLVKCLANKHEDTVPV